jgi:hypothetical protein
MPTVEGSASGLVFLILGGIAGFIAAAMFIQSSGIRNSSSRVFGFLGIAGGAWLGKIVHQMMGGGSNVNQSQPNQNPRAEWVNHNTQSAHSQTHQQAHVTDFQNASPIIASCPKCQQKLRVRPFTSWPTLKCNSCQNAFQLTPDFAYNAALGLWKSEATRSQSLHWIRIAAQAGHKDARLMAITLRMNF